MKNLFVLICLLIFPTFSLANPAPFGLELGKTTYDQAKEKYDLQSYEETNASFECNGKNYEIDPQSLNIDGIIASRLTFNERGILVAVHNRFEKSRFDSLLKNLSSKYKVVKKNVPFVGDSYVSFRDGDWDIFLDAPHLSFSLDLLYIEKNLYQKARSIYQDDKAKKSRNEASQL